MPTQSSKLWRRRSNRKLILAIFGFCLSLFGLLFGLLWEDIFYWIMKKEMALRPGTTVYESWRTPPLELNLDIYLYNWTNPEEFGNLSTKPILEQLGPYRFRENPDKVDIVWHDANASVTYRKRSYYYFDAEASAGSLDDVVITLNAVALSAANKAKQWSIVRRQLVDVGLKLYSQEISVIKTVDELLFTGYSDSMIDMARAMPVFGEDIRVPFDKFGWFYTRNGSAELTGIFNVYTGVDDLSKLGQMHTWNYQENSGFFDSHCGINNGSAGEFQPQKLKPGDSIGLFTPDMCRTLPLDYLETVEIEGVEGLKFTGGPRSVDNGTLYPENLCYCGGECVRSGVMNISACRFDTPVFMSYPHFYNADPFYVDQVEGLAPNQRDHEFYLTLEPHTGIALEVAARFQVNMLVEPIVGLTMYQNIPRIFFPLIWFEQKVHITPELADQLKLLPIVLLAGHIFAGICFAMGLILLCWTPVERMCWKRKHYDLKVQQHRSNGQPRSTRSQFNSAEELKSKSAHASEKIADHSPLLDRNHIATVSLAVSEATKQD